MAYEDFEAIGPHCFLNILKCWGFRKTPKIPKIWGILGDLNPKNPQNLYHPRPQNTPEIFLGIFGDKTQKNPKIKLIPIPKKSPKIVQALPPSPPRP